MPLRFLLVGTFAGGVLLSILSWFSAAILPPRFKQFENTRAVSDVILTHTTADGIYTAPQGLFVAVSLRSRAGSQVTRVIGQFAVEFGIAFGFALLLLATPLTTPLQAGSVFGLMGLLAGIETHFPNWNWAGFPNSYLLAGSAYLAMNWFLAGLALGAIRRKLQPQASRS